MRLGFGSEDALAGAITNAGGRRGRELVAVQAVPEVAHAGQAGVASLVTFLFFVGREGRESVFVFGVVFKVNVPLLAVVSLLVVGPVEV